MKEKQRERLNKLVKTFAKDSGQYGELNVDDETMDDDQKRQILRSLMNIRMPGDLPESVLKLQDEYLREHTKTEGIVALSDIPTIGKAYGSNHPFAEQLSIWQGDITRLSCDAIVNAANSQMLGCFRPMHACIDNCIHTYAGIQLRLECDRQMQKFRLKYGMDYEQSTAKPMLTDGYNLPAKKVIHIVGPIVQGRLNDVHRQALASCYQNTLDLCLENGLKSVAFCCISTGVFCFPNEEAAKIAVETVTDWMNRHEGSLERVIFNVFKDEDKAYYEEIL